MARTKQVSDSIVIATDPTTAYEVVSHPDRIPDFSPENTRGVVESDGDAYVGMRFQGINHRSGVTWVTGCEVTAADPGRHFAFKVRRYGFFGKPLLPVKVATWDYRFEPVDGGTRVTETWTDDRQHWPDVFARGFDWVATGDRGGFAAFQRGNIAKSLAGLKRLLERS